MVTKKNLNLQVLRGIACIFICINHFTFFNKYGFGQGGVEIFVILSGYLTMKNYYDHNKRISKHYFFKKVCSIIPLYWGLTLLVFIIGSLLPSLFNSLNLSFTNLMYSLLLFPNENQFILYPGWTLTYFFYFYFIVWLSYHIDKKIKLEIKVSSIIIAMILLSIISKNSCLMTLNNMIMLEFVYGILLYSFIEKIELSFQDKFQHLFGFVSIILLLFLFLLPKVYFDNRYLIPSVSAIIIIYCFISLGQISFKYNYLQVVGNISFTVYLLHPLIIRPIDKLCQKFLGGSLPNTVLYAPIVLIIVCLISYLLNKLINKYLSFKLN